jgi:hypothetical protein
MKMLLTGIAAALMASGAVAQTMSPVGPPAPGAAMAAPVAPAAEAPAAPAVEPAPAAAATTTLVQRGGKWWNGDHPASKTEIAAWKKAQKPGAGA